MIKQVKVPKKLLGASGGEANDKDDEANAYFEFREEVKFREECHKEAEAISNITKVATGKQRLSVIGECVVEDKKNK